MSHNLDVALALASHGVSVFPCQPDKKPRPGVRWRDEATTDEARISAWWRRWPESLPAFEPGRHGILVIDCDRHGGPDGVGAMVSLALANGDDARDWPTVQTPSDGRHIFFAQPGGFGNQRGKLPAGIDVRGEGGYVIAEGAVLPDGRMYHAPDGSCGLVDAMAGDAMPQLPAWLEALLRAKVDGSNDNTAPAAPAAPAARLRPVPGTREAAAFQAALDAECATVRGSGKGGRNNTLNTAAFSVGTAVGAGWGTRSEAESALTDAGLACGLDPVEVRKTIKSGLDKGVASPRPPLRDRDDSGPVMDCSTLIARSRATVIDGVLVDEETGEVIEPDEDDEEAEEDPAVAIDHGLADVPGVLGRLVDWITDCGTTGNRLLSLSVALPLLATVLGRRCATPTNFGGGLELYVVVCYPTGGGKGAQIGAAASLMSACKLERHFTSAEYVSGAAIDSRIVSSPLTLSVIDEYAEFISKITGRKSQIHQVEIGKKLTKLYGYGFKPYDTDTSRDRAPVVVHGPCFSVYGMTTKASLFRTVKGKDISGGFINRHTFIDAGEETRQKPKLDARKPPPALVREILRLYNLGKRGGGNLDIENKNLDHNPDPFIIPWESAEAEKAYDDFETECSRLKRDDEDLGEVFSRTAFMAVKLATIRACSDNPANPRVSVEHLNWGADLAMQSAKSFRAEAARNMIDVLEYPEVRRKIMDKLTAAGGTLPKRKLWQDTHKNFKNPFDFDNLLKAMSGAQEVAVFDMKTKGRLGKKTLVELIYRERKKS